MLWEDELGRFTEPSFVDPILVVRVNFQLQPDKEQENQGLTLLRNESLGYLSDKPKC